MAKKRKNKEHGAEKCKDDPEKSASSSSRKYKKTDQNDACQRPDEKLRVEGSKSKSPRNKSSVLPTPEQKNEATEIRKATDISNKSSIKLKNESLLKKPKPKYGVAEQNSARKRKAERKTGVDLTIHARATKTSPGSKKRGVKPKQEQRTSGRIRKLTPKAADAQSLSSRKSLAAKRHSVKEQELSRSSSSSADDPIRTSSASAAEPRGRSLSSSSSDSRSVEVPAFHDSLSDHSSYSSPVARKKLGGPRIITVMSSASVSTLASKKFRAKSQLKKAQAVLKDHFKRNNKPPEHDVSSLKSRQSEETDDMLPKSEKSEMKITSETEMRTASEAKGQRGQKVVVVNDDHFAENSCLGKRNIEGSSVVESVSKGSDFNGDPADGLQSKETGMEVQDHNVSSASKEVQVAMDGDSGSADYDELEQSEHVHGFRDEDQGDDFDVSKTAPRNESFKVGLERLVDMQESEEKVLGGVSALVKDSLLQIEGMHYFITQELPSLTNITCFQTADKMAISGTIQGVTKSWTLLSNIEQRLQAQKDGTPGLELQLKSQNGTEKQIFFKKSDSAPVISPNRVVKPVTVFVDIKKTENKVGKQTKFSRNSEDTSNHVEEVANSGQQSSSHIQIKGEVGVEIVTNNYSESNFAESPKVSKPRFSLNDVRKLDQKTTGVLDESIQQKLKERLFKNISEETAEDEVDEDEDNGDKMQDETENEIVTNRTEDDQSDMIVWQEKDVQDIKQECHCDICNSSFSSENALWNHKYHAHDVKEKNPNAFAQCDACLQRFRGHLELEKHQKRAHNGCDKVGLKHIQYTCQVCGKKFAEKRYLSTHLKRHAGIRKHRCEICGWRFFEGHKLKFHLETHKQENDRKLPYRCTICLHQYHNRQSWNDHMNTHSGAKPYWCSNCNASFAHRIGLHRHKLTHEKLPSFQCSYCNRGFKVKANLNAHMTTHTGISKHSCDNCGKVFTVATSLRRHKCVSKSYTMDLSQNRVEPEESCIYMCGVCSETFPTMALAESHSLIHIDSATQDTNLSGVEVMEVAEDTDFLNPDFNTTAEQVDINIAQNSSDDKHPESSNGPVDEEDKVHIAASMLADLSSLKDVDVSSFNNTEVKVQSVQP